MNKAELSCREYVVSVAPGRGVVLTFGDGEEHLLQAGDFPVSPMLSVSRYTEQIVISEQFGVKQLTESDGMIGWKDISGLPNQFPLHDYLLSVSAGYFIYREDDISWRGFQKYQLFHAGSTMAVVKTDSNAVKIIRFGKGGY